MTLPLVVLPSCIINLRPADLAGHGASNGWSRLSFQTYSPSVYSRGDVDVVSDQQRLFRGKLNDKTLVARTVQIVGQNTNHLASPSTCTSLARLANARPIGSSTSDHVRCSVDGPGPVQQTEMNAKKAMTAAMRTAFAHRLRRISRTKIALSFCMKASYRRVPWTIYFWTCVFTLFWRTSSERKCAIVR